MTHARRVLPVLDTLTGSILVLPGIADALARAIYDTDLAEARTKFDKRFVPAWDDVGEEIVDYVTAQAVSAAEVVDQYRAAVFGKRPPKEPGSVAGNLILREDIARAIYRTHHGRGLPTWKQASEDLRRWYRQRAMSVARTVDDAVAQHEGG